MEILSFYNIYIPIPRKNRYLLFNTFSSTLFEIDYNLGKILEENSNPDEFMIDKIDIPYYKELKKHGYIVDNNKQERQIVKNLKLTKYKQAIDQNIGFTLFLTNSCNLACPYCFQGLNKPVSTFMKEKYILNIINYLHETYQQKQFKNLSISWYGGEPLLYPKLIKQYTPLFKTFCDRFNVSYNAGIVTNGTALTPSNIRILEENDVSYIQVTIDGPRVTHDKYRPFKDSANSSYDTIINNLKALNTNIRISIRVNLDKVVSSQINWLFKDLINSKIWPYKKNISLYVAMTTPTLYYKDDKLFTLKEFSSEILKIRREKVLLYNEWANNNNMAQCRFKFQIPVFSYNMCGTYHNPRSMVVDSLGNVSKCWEHTNYEEIVMGNLNETTINEIITSKKYMNLIENIDIPDKCVNCKIHPICDGVLCIDSHLKKIERCSVFKYNLKEMLKEQYLMSIDHPNIIESFTETEDRINNGYTRVIV